MRSRKSLFLIAAVLLLVPAAAFANGGWTIDARGGVGIPTGNYKDGFKSGLLIGVEASKMMNPQWSIGLDGNYIKNKGDEAVFGTGTDVDTKLTHYGAHAKFMMSKGSENKFMPYLVGGGGLYHLKLDNVTPTPGVDDSATKFGIRGGIGANVMMGPRWGLGFQGDYNDIFTSGSSTQFIGVSGGLHFMLQPGSAK